METLASLYNDHRRAAKRAREVLERNKLMRC